MIRDWAEHSVYADRIRFFPEDPILGTGGALKNAEAFLARSPFIVHNADILLDIDFKKLVTTHLQAGNIATLATHRHPALSNVVVDDNDLVLDVENPGHSRPDPDRIAAEGRLHGRSRLLAGDSGFVPQGVSHATVAWLDAARMETPGSGPRLPPVRTGTTSARLPRTPELFSTSFAEAARRFIGRRKRLAAKSGLTEYVVLEARSIVEDNTHLRNCIVMPGARGSGRQGKQGPRPGETMPSTSGKRKCNFPLHAREQKKISLSDPLSCPLLRRGWPSERQRFQ